MINKSCSYFELNNYKHIYYSYEYKKEFIPHIYERDGIVNIFKLYSNVD